MQYTITINQFKSLEWGLNSQQAMLFAFVYECPSWANPVKTDDGVFFALSKAKIVCELPLLSGKPDTAYRMLKALEDAGLVQMSSTSKITLIRLTDKGKEWNRKHDGSENYPSNPEGGRKKIRGTSDKSPSKVGKKSELTSDKSPTNQGTNNQGTNQETNNQNLQVVPASPIRTGELVLVIDRPDAPRVEIPSDMPGPKDPDCKTFKTWANYAVSYRRRYKAWPVWNAKVAGQIGLLIGRLGIEVSHSVAAYYLGINDAMLIRKCHSLSELLANAEGYHTQWKTNTQTNGETARQQEKTQANINAAQEASRSILEGGNSNAFLRRNR